MSENICPICGGELSKEVYFQNPPNRSRKCTKCGRMNEMPREKVFRRPRNGYNRGAEWSTY